MVEVDNLDDYGVIFCGFPVQASGVPGKAEGFLNKIGDEKKLALFGTHGSLRGVQLAITAFYHAITLAPKATGIGTFGC